jgi:hypothetical protein
MFIGNTNDGTVCKINEGQHAATVEWYRKRRDWWEPLKAGVVARAGEPPIAGAWVFESTVFPDST